MPEVEICTNDANMVPVNDVGNVLAQPYHASWLRWWYTLVLVCVFRFHHLFGALRTLGFVQEARISLFCLS